MYGVLCVGFAVFGYSEFPSAAGRCQPGRLLLRNVATQIRCHAELGLPRLGYKDFLLGIQ